ncbi:MAG: OmpA/MotB family protein [Bacteriovoracaceae bacterium]|jgi:chemotaxis protein MotB
MADQKCPPCKAGAPAWMASFADMCTLLLTFFILLLSFAKTETAKYEAAMGSIRNAFGGNVLKAGEVVQLGKSPSDALTMMDAETPAAPFPINFLTSEGLLDKKEINRESDAQLSQVQSMLKDNELTQDVDVYEMPESIVVRLKEKINFKNGSTAIEDINIQVFERLIKLMRDNAWNIMVEGHAEKNETFKDGDAYSLSSARALAVSKALIGRGVSSDRITTIFYGDSRPQKEEAGVKSNNRRVEFLIRKSDLRVEGRKVQAE